MRWRSPNGSVGAGQPLARLFQMCLNLANGKGGVWIAPGWHDRGKGAQYKIALAIGGVGDSQHSTVPAPARPQDDVDVHASRAPAPVPTAAQSTFDVLKQSEQRGRRQRCFDQHRAVGKDAGGRPDRWGGDDGRATKDAHMLANKGCRFIDQPGGRAPRGQRAIGPDRPRLTVNACVAHPLAPIGA